MDTEKQLLSQSYLAHLGGINGFLSKLSLTLNSLSLLILISCGAILFKVDPALAGDCSVVSSDGTPLTYTLGSNLGGANGLIREGASLEDRAIKLEKVYSVTFNCPSTTTVDLQVTATTITAPNFASSSADNLDLIGSDTTGVTHLVDVTASNMTPITDKQANSHGTTIVNPATDGQNLNLDASGNITVNLVSTYTLTGGAEELGAGDYGTQFVISVNGGGAIATNTTNIEGAVAKECSVDTRSQFTSGGSPLPYQISTGTVGGEDRVTKFEAGDRIVFDCNAPGFNYSLSLDTLTAPNFTNAANLDLVPNSGETGVNHEVVIDLKFPAGNPSNIQTTYSKVTTGSIVSSNSTNIDLNGDVEIELTSRFQTINSAEELGAGNYETGFTITVTAQ